MALRCRLLGHTWRVHGGIAANAGGNGEPENVQYGCDRCGERRTIFGLDVATVAHSHTLRRDPDAAERMSRLTKRDNMGGM